MYAMRFENPQKMLAVVEKRMSGIPNVKLFNDSANAKLRESWCASLFGYGLERVNLSCEVAINESKSRLDVDFYLKIAKEIYGFQLVEAQEPERRRGLEYKELESGMRKTVPYTPERGRLEGPSWIRHAIEKKCLKRYAESQTLNLLIYANFSARQLEYDDIVSECRAFLDSFSAVWVLSSVNMCCISAGGVFSLMKGWVHIRSIGDYYS